MIRHEIYAPNIQLQDLHPEAVYHHETALAKNFVRGLTSSTTLDPCPFCGSQRHEVLFEKWGQRYALCPRTWSLSLGRMPSNSELYQYAFDSDLARYRASDEYQYLFRTLRQELWNGQIEWAEGRICRHLKMDRYRVLDWGPRMTGWIEIARKAAFVGEYVLAEPLPPLSTDGEPTQCEVVLLFDVLQRHAHPDKLLARIFSALKPGGLLLLTSRSGTGFDILTLADESESIFPLDHVCLPSPQGLKMSLEQAGFTVLELTTPGLLDVQLVRQGKNNIPISHYFQRYVINQFGTDMHERLQAFLQQNNLSSHMRAVAVKGSCND